MIVPTAATRGKVHVRATTRRRDRQAVRRVVAQLVGQYPNLLTTADKLPVPTQGAGR